jgi:hypothetical protein
VLLALAAGTLLAFVGSNWMFPAVSPVRHEYFQVWPMRFLFPAIGLALFVAFRERGFPDAGVAILGTISGVAVVWNIDSGVPVLGGFIAFLLIRFALGGAERRAVHARHLGIALAAPALVIAAFLFYLETKSQDGIRLGDWIKYQRIFYESGFGMLPLPLTLHPWMTAVALHVFGLIVGLEGHLRRRPTLRSDALIFLSVLGLGLFTYYQGRSHVIVLSFVVWPAVLTAFVLADNALRVSSAGIMQKPLRLASIPVVAFGLIATVNWVKALPANIGVAAEVMSGTDMDRAARPLRLIEERLNGARSAVIIHPGQSVLLGELGLSSPLDGPGLVEMLLQEDLDRFLAALDRGDVADVFVRLDRDGEIPAIYRDALDGYEPAARDGRMLHLTLPRSEDGG